MINNSKVIWKGKPKYVFKSSLLEQDNYYDALMGVSGILHFYIIFVFITLFIIERLLSLDFSIWIYAIVMLIAIVIPDIIVWDKLSSKHYVLTSSNLEIYSEHNTLLKRVRLDQIMNMFSLNENKDIETIVITYKHETSGKVLKLKVENVYKSEDLRSKIEKLK